MAYDVVGETWPRSEEENIQTGARRLRPQWGRIPSQFVQIHEESQPAHCTDTIAGIQAR